MTPCGVAASWSRSPSDREFREESVGVEPGRRHAVRTGVQYPSGLLIAALLTGCATWVDEDELRFDSPVNSPSTSKAIAPDRTPGPVDDRRVDADEEPAQGSGTLCVVRVSEPVRARSVENLRASIQTREREIQSCYSDALRRDAFAAGRVRMSFIVAGDGAVPIAVVRDSEISDRPMLACLRATIRSWNLGPSRNGDLVLVHYPYVFARRRG